MSDRLAVFRDGRIEQVGPPAQVYERPATEFVASFVGTSNVIATATGRAVLRPEKVAISAAPLAPGATGATGRVVDVAYLGMATRYTVELDDGRTITAVRQNASRGADVASLAHQVSVTWDVADAFPLTTTSGPDVQAGHSTKEQHE